MRPEIGFLDRAQASIIESLNTAEAAIVEGKYNIAEKEFKKLQGGVALMGFDGLSRVLESSADVCKLAGSSGWVIQDSPQEVLVPAIKEFHQYVLDLLNGAPDLPVKLLGVFRSLRSALRTGSHPAQLFFPNLDDLSKWGAINKELSASYAEEAQKWQTIFTKALVPWVKNKNDKSALNEAQDVLLEMTDDMSLPLCYIAFFSSAIAAIDVIKTKEAPDKFDEMVLGRIEAEIKNISFPVPSSFYESWRFVLFTVAFSSLQTGHVLTVKERQGLDSYIDAIRKEGRRSGHALSEDKLATVKESLSRAEDAWMRLVDKEIQPAELEEIFTILVSTTEVFNHPAIEKLGKALIQLSQGISSGRIVIKESLANETAILLLLIERAIMVRGRISAEFEQAVMTQIQRMLAAVRNDTSKLSQLRNIEFDSESIAAFNKTLKIQVLQELKSELKTAEDALGHWFRETSLDGVKEIFEKVNPLVRLTPVLKMLGLFDAARVLENTLPKIGQLLRKTVRPLPQDEQWGVISRLAAIHLYITAAIAGQNNAQRFLRIVEPKRREEEEILSKFEEDLAREDGFEGEWKKQTIQETLDVVGDLETLQVYLEDMKDQLEIVDKAVIGLSKDLTDDAYLADVRRAFHTIKGSGRMVNGLVLLPNVAEVIEHYIKTWIASGRHATKELVETIRQAETHFKVWSEELSEQQSVKVEAASLLKLFKEETLTDSSVSVSLDKVAQEEGDREAAEALQNILLEDCLSQSKLLKEEWFVIAESNRKYVTEDFAKTSHSLLNKGQLLNNIDLTKVLKLVVRWSDFHNQGENEIQREEYAFVASLLNSLNDFFESSAHILKIDSTDVDFLELVLPKIEEDVVITAQPLPDGISKEDLIKEITQIKARVLEIELILNNMSE